MRAASAVLLVLALGCGSDDKIVGPRRTIPIPTGSSPQQTLQNLVFAYNSRDSVVTAVVYDDTYSGVSVYPGSPPGGLQVSKSDEVRHVGWLKLDANIVSILLDMGHAATWQRLPGALGDPPGWAVIPIPNSTVRIDDHGTSTIWESKNSTMEFTFKPTVNAPGDTTWTVIRWTEFAN